MKEPHSMDPVLKEMHAIKDANSQRFDGDLSRQFRHLKSLQVRSGKRIIRTRNRQSGKASPLNP
jgi:hypothetical protein